MPMAKRTALVTGASGLAGGYMLAHLLEQGGWDIVAVSRRKPQISGDYRHIAVDLLDLADCRTKLGPLTNISHLFYLAITERPDPGETMSANANMFFNLVKTVEAASPALEHVHLSQGTRWYGNHLGPYKTPTREDDPRHMPPNFYYDQQDFLEEFQQGKRWTWSVGRPHAVCGFSTGGPMNLTLAIAVYANVCKALGLPLSFPGKPGAYTALYQVRQLLRDGTGSATTHQPCEVDGRQRSDMGRHCRKEQIAEIQLQGDCGVGLPGWRLRFRLRYRLRYEQSPPLRIPRSGGHRGNVFPDVFGFSA